MHCVLEVQVMLMFYLHHTCVCLLAKFMVTLLADTSELAQISLLLSHDLLSDVQYVAQNFVLF